MVEQVWDHWLSYLYRCNGLTDEVHLENGAVDCITWHIHTRTLVLTTVYCRRPLSLLLLLKSEPSESIQMACHLFTYIFIPRRNALSNQGMILTIGSCNVGIKNAWSHNLHIYAFMVCTGTYLAYCLYCMCWHLVFRISLICSLAVGNLCMITGGRNLGRVGTVVNRERHPGSFDIVHVKDSQGHTFATR
jgi:Ribosomal protein S4E